MSEMIWKSIEGYKNLYQVSSNGKIRSLYAGENGGKYVAIPVKSRINRYGYVIVDLYKSGKRTTKTMHRLVAITFIPNPKNLVEINHIDGDKTNNNVENLEWCTKSYNIIHSYRTGLNKPFLGESRANAKLSLAQVREIRAKYMTGNFSQKKLAKEYGVVQNTIFCIVNNKTYKDIT